MDNKEYSECPIRHIVSKFGDKWSLLVLYTIYLNGTMRFSELHRHMNDCSHKMLSTTLKKLEKHHLVTRQLYAEVPPRVEYSLSVHGQSLMPTLMALVEWGKEHFEQVCE